MCPEEVRHTLPVVLRDAVDGATRQRREQGTVVHLGLSECPGEIGDSVRRQISTLLQGSGGELTEEHSLAESGRRKRPSCHRDVNEAASVAFLRSLSSECCPAEPVGTVLEDHFCEAPGKFCHVRRAKVLAPGNRSGREALEESLILPA